MRKDKLNLYVSALLIAALIFSFLTIYAFGEHESSGFSVSAKSAVLYQPETENFLYSKNADIRLPMASTTKIMTALVAIENSNPDELVEINDSAIGTEGSSAYLRKGDILTMEELLYALLLQSANDAAVAIACHIGGGIEGFAALMNDRAAELGLTDTHFTNPHGLDGKEHYTTARELSLIAAEALKNPTFKRIASTYKKSFVTEDRSRTYVNHNKLLRLYDGCVGVKTGFTRKSGRCLVGAAEREGLTFITVTLDAPSDWSDHREMLDFGFESLERISFAKGFDHIYKIPVLDGESEYLTVANPDGAEVITERGEREIYEHIRLVKYAIAPINAGDKLGEIIYTADGKEAARIPLLATESVNKKKADGLFDKILSLFK